jgi:hypothetical protein
LGFAFFGVTPRAVADRVPPFLAADAFAGERFAMAFFAPDLRDFGFAFLAAIASPPDRTP